MPEPAPAPAAAPPAKGGKCVALGCGAMLLLCLILGVIGAVKEAMKSPEQKAAEAAAREKAKAEREQKGRDLAKALAKKLAAVARALPPKDALVEKKAPELEGKAPRFTPADPGFFAQFDDEGWVQAKDAPYAWPRSSHLETARDCLMKIAKKEDYYVSTLESAHGEIESRPCFGVIYPLALAHPKLAPDGAQFVPGEFDGFVVLVEKDTAKVTRIARFTATSSGEIKRTVVKVAGIKLGADMQKKLQDDFNQNVITEALLAIQR